jgi:hypothetical protein
MQVVPIALTGQRIIHLRDTVLVRKSILHQIRILNIAGIGLLTELVRINKVCPVKANKLIEGLTLTLLGLMDSETVQDEITFACQDFIDCPLNEMRSHAVYAPISNYLANAA